LKATETPSERRYASKEKLAMRDLVRLLLDPEIKRFVWRVPPTFLWALTVAPLSEYAANDTVFAPATFCAITATIALTFLGDPHRRLGDGAREIRLLGAASIRSIKAATDEVAHRRVGGFSV
jgi:hypothetical protein